METLIRNLRDKQALAKLIGEAPAFIKVIAQLPVVAKSDATVLVTGETGTGKELVARAIHYLSARAALPFVTLNCGSLPDTLVEEELFGHERGAFTDAHARRQGLVAQAHRGTLFLDEVGTLSPKAQTDLLRVIDNKEFRAVGSSAEQTVDLRVVAATNIPLDRLVGSGSFRADLYYRLSVFLVSLPPLRERPEDILRLAEHFLRKYASATDKGTLKLSPAACETLISWSWPGNVRELENAIIRGSHLSSTELIQAEDLGLQVSDEKTGKSDALGGGTKLRTLRDMKREMIEMFERDYLARLMFDHQGNVSHAARAAGKERRDLGKLLKKYGLNPTFFRRVAAPGLDNRA